MKSIGGPELIIILVIVVLLFGATKLPGLAKGIGESIRVFRKEVRTKDEPEKAEGSAKPEAEGSKPTEK
ncbi:MAG: twin-arginine translocase TatA/TatE family subunit [Micrococcales bacterium]